MAITERLMGAGSFGVTFLQDQTPSEIIDAINEWGHIVVTPQEMNPDLFDDASMLAAARYTGIVLAKTLEEGVVTVAGQGLQLYLGDDRGKGMVIAENKNIGSKRDYSSLPLSSVLFQSSTPYGIMRDASGNLQAITQGTIHDGSSTYTGSHFVETALHALKHICETLSYEFRVNPDATLDAGPAANLFTGVNTDPTTVVVKTGYGDDPTYQGISPVGARTEFDARDYVTKVDFIAEVGAFNEPTDFEGEAALSAGSIPYYDIHGNKLSRTGLVTVPDMDSDKLNDQATLMLNELSRVKKTLNLDLEQYEVTGDLKVGDFIFAFDPILGFNDDATQAAAESRDIYEIAFRGQQINPIKVRVVGLSFPIQTGMGVYFRSYNGSTATYTDLTPFVSFETGDTQVELGDVLRDVSDDMRFNEFSIAARTASAKSIPDIPSTPTLQSGTYLDGTGESKGFIRIVFSKPSNIDGSSITDGSHYRVRYRVSDGLSTSGGASANEYTFLDFPFTGASTETLMITDLTVGKSYRVGVATVDTSGFRRKTDYTATGTDIYTDTASINSNFATNAVIEIARDGQAPSKPKQATSISAGPLRVQVTHYLGKAGTDGNGNPFGDFTLEGDVDHLDVHAVTQSGNTSNFTVNTANKIGELRVTSGNILQQIPVIGTMELEDSQDYYFRIVAVDKSGNESAASDGQSAVANLIQEANISDLTVTDAKIATAAITEAKIANLAVTDAKIASLTADKLTAGTIDASVITVSNLDASNITSGTISADRISGGSISADLISGGSISADLISGGTINGSNISVTNLNADNINTGTLNGNQIENNAISSSKIQNNAVTNDKIQSVEFGKVTAVSISASDITTGTLNGNNVNVTNLSASNITGGTLNAALIGGTAISLAFNITSTSGTITAQNGDVVAGGNVQTGDRLEHKGATNSFIDIGSSSSFTFRPNGGSTGLQLSRDTTSFVNSNWLATSNNSKNLGSSFTRWKEVFAVNGSINTSDITLKTDVETTSLGLDFVNTLNPIEYRWEDGGVRTHLGFSAQDIKQKLIDYKGSEQNYAMYTQGSYEVDGYTETDRDGNLLEDPDEDWELYGLRITELIPSLTKAIQELSVKVDSLTARIEVLEG